ncbi:MAG: OsmC family protein, partial [Flavobacteriales bacterium]
MADSTSRPWDYTVKYEDPLRTLNTHLASGETVVTDAPTDNHGLGQAFSPTDLLSTSLVACIMTIMGIHAQAKPYRLDTMDARVRKTMAANPRRVAAIEIEIEVVVSGEASERGPWPVVRTCARKRARFHTRGTGGMCVCTAVC